MVTKATSKKAAVTAKESTKKSKYSLNKVFPWILIVGSIIGLLSAATLMVEKVFLLENPSASLSCDLNPVIACGSVIGTPQASAFGFPNPILGLIGFGVVLTVGMALLAGAQFKRWFWLGLQVGTLFGVFFVSWLQYQSFYVIGALCPYCMAVWTVTIIMFVYTLAYNLRNAHILLPNKLAGVSAFIQKYPFEIAFTWLLILFLAIVEQFWYYWSTLL